MIISASRRTDIPAFYAAWFMQRLRAGYFYRVNPFNSRQVTAFSLKPEHVDAICFWSKNPQPLLQYLPELDGRGLNYYFQFTLNPYDKTFEPSVPPLAERIATLSELAGRIGPERVVWRYDPIILSTQTPVPWHLEQVERLAALLTDATRRMMFSFYDFYGKGQGRLQRALAGSGITVADIAAATQSEARAQLVRGFKACAERHGLQIYSCCEEVEPALTGIRPGACIDAALIRQLFGVTAAMPKDRHQRQACRCAAAVDMGAYNSCPMRCSYCYANFNPGLIDSNCRKHRLDSPALLSKYEGDFAIRTGISPENKGTATAQQNLLSPE